MSENSKQLTEVLDQLNHRVLISHMLNIKVSPGPLNEQDELALRTELKRRIWGVQLIEDVLHNGFLFPASITWEMTNTGGNTGAHSANYYYAVNLPYVDSVIATHTRTALSDICDSIRATCPQFGRGWRLSYLISKPVPITRSAPMPFPTERPKPPQVEVHPYLY